MHDEAGVDGKLAPIASRDLVGIGVAAKAAICFEQRDLGGPGQDVSGREAGHPAADDRDLAGRGRVRLAARQPWTPPSGY
jgi:hypothetical protein